MSRDTSKEGYDSLDIIREEISPTESTNVMKSESPPTTEEEISMKESSGDKIPEKETGEKKFSAEEVEALLKKKEDEITEYYEKCMDREMYLLRDRCDYILLNEQIRASHMLREAHRERQEKISALQTQLECKNMAALMYVLCTERIKTKFEKLRIIQDYQEYISGLEKILIEAQDLILHLSRGYKTAARVDNEWREKMKSVLKEFLTFIYDFAGGTPETNQYFFNIPELLKIKESVVDNPDEDPCECLCDADEDEEEGGATCDCDNPASGKGFVPDEEKVWWDDLEETNRPFIMFGDMESFNPPLRREVLRRVKATKTAPRKWKEYVFNEMFLKSNCSHANEIKDVIPDNIPIAPSECYIETENGRSSLYRNTSKMSAPMYSRQRAVSVDIRGGMGSLLKIMTTAHIPPPHNKANILGARDSIEIQSSQRLRKDSHRTNDTKSDVLNIKSRHESLFDSNGTNDTEEDAMTIGSPTQKTKTEDDEKIEVRSASIVDSLHIQTHEPDADHKIHYEKVCPMEKCKRMQIDDFMRSLPPYMNANPFTYFEQSFDDYETCTPEQLEALKARIKEKKLIEKSRKQMHEPGIFDEWEAIPGIAVQTSEVSMSLPPCSCRAPYPTPQSSLGMIYDVSAVKALEPIKATLDKIHATCFHDNRIQFDRFQVVGEGQSQESLAKKPKDTGKARLQAITKVLKLHPSLLDIFQANQQ